MLALVEQLKTTTQLRWNKVHKFKAKIQLFIEMGPYIIKTAESPQELIESFKLRHEVFIQEFCESETEGLDFDRFDYFFDHLIILHKESKKVIGTYRLNCSTFSKESYTALEFDLSALLSLPGPHLELGRACIKKEFRKGSVISLLWRGICEYMNLAEAEILFGCSSVKVNTPRDAALLYRYLVEAGHTHLQNLSHPTLEFTMKDFTAWEKYYTKGLTIDQKQEAEELLPSLVKSYLKMGAKVACEPAFDRDFDCIDLLTVLHKKSLANSLAQKFQVVR